MPYLRPPADVVLRADLRILRSRRARAPSSLYRPSERSYPSRIQEVEYASEMTVRRVRTKGEIKWKGELIYLSEALVGEPVGLIPESDRYLAVFFGPMKLCLMDQATHQIVRIAPEWKP